MDSWDRKWNFMCAILGQSILIGRSNGRSLAWLQHHELEASFHQTIDRLLANGKGFPNEDAIIKNSSRSDRLEACRGYEAKQPNWARKATQGDRSQGQAWSSSSIDDLPPEDQRQKK